MTKSLFRLIGVILLLLPLAGLDRSVVQSQQGSRVTFRIREPNVHAPDLYADNLTLKITLVNLPGAGDPHSYSEVSYQVVFVPEDQYYAALQELPPGGSNPALAQFQGRILLAEGTIKKNVLATIQQRTSSREFPFKVKVPDGKRTKFAHLLTSYSVKIFDAKLKKSVYRSGIFSAFPFDDASDQSKVSQRQILYLSFLVSDDGELARSQRARRDGDTSW